MQARSFDTRVVATQVDLSNLSDVAVPTDMSAPIVNYAGPREIDQGAAIMMPDNFAEVPDVANVEYAISARKAIKAEGIVVRCESAGEQDAAAPSDGGKEAELYSLGIAFLHLAPEDHRRVEAYVNWRLERSLIESAGS